MLTLHHHPLCPQSRFVRLACAELGLDLDLVDERPWERRVEFLTLNPAGETPVLIAPDGLVVPGAGVIAAYLDEAMGHATPLLPPDMAGRVEVRRLLHWFLGKFYDEVTGYLVTEKIYKRFMAFDAGGGPPDMNAIRAARTNIRYHLKYLAFLLAGREWLAGPTLTYADLAAGAHFSSADYLGDVPWAEEPLVRDWYARLKSRPAFRGLLGDRVAGMAPADHYTNLDF